MKPWSASRSVPGSSSSTSNSRRQTRQWKCSCGSVFVSLADGLRTTSCEKESRLGELGERGVHGAAPELRNDRGSPRVDLVRGKMLGWGVGEDSEDPLDAQGSLGAHARGAARRDPSRVPFLLFSDLSSGQLVRTMSYLGGIRHDPSHRPPADGAAAAVDTRPGRSGRSPELLGGKFGELSTFMNYTFQSFNFEPGSKRGLLRPGGEHRRRGFGHIELVSHHHQHDAHRRPASERAAQPRRTLTEPPAVHRRRRGGALPQDSNGNPWNGDYVKSTGDLVEDLTHNFFLETGARNNKLKVYEMVDHPAARALTGYLLVRGGVHQVAYARAVEPHRRRPDEAVPLAADPDRPDPGVPAAHRPRRAHQAVPLLARATTSNSPRCSTAPTPRPARSSSSATTPLRACPPFDLPPRRASSRRTRARGDRRDRPQARKRPDCPRSRPAS